MKKLQTEISEFSTTSLALGKVGLIVLEKQKDYSVNLKKVEKIFKNSIKLFAEYLSEYSWLQDIHEYLIQYFFSLYRNIAIDLGI